MKMIKKILIALLCWTATSMASKCYGQELGLVTVAPGVDTGTYVVGTRDSAGHYHTYRWSIAQLKAYINTGIVYADTVSAGGGLTGGKAAHTNTLAINPAYSNTWTVFQNFGGNISVGTSGSQTGKISLRCQGNSNQFIWESPDTIVANYSLAVPKAAPNGANMAMVSDGNSGSKWTKMSGIDSIAVNVADFLHSLWIINPTGPTATIMGSVTPAPAHTVVVNGSSSSAAPAYGQVDLSTAEITGVLPVAAGGTNATTQTSINAVPITYGANNNFGATGPASGDLTGFYPSPTLSPAIATTVTWSGGQTFTNTGGLFYQENAIAASVQPAVTFQNSVSATSGSKVQLPGYLYASGYCWDGSSSVNVLTRQGWTKTSGSGGNIPNPVWNLDWSINGGSTWTNALAIGTFGSSPASTFAGGIQVNGSSGLFVPNGPIQSGLSVAAGTSGIFNSCKQTTVGGSTSGSAIFSEPEQGSSYKKVVVYCAALLGTASYTFPTAFLNTPLVVNSDVNVTALSTTAITITGSALTEYIIIEGY